MVINTVKKVIDPIRNEICSYRVTLVDENKTLYVPLSEDNTDYQEIQKWVAAGNTIEEAD